MFKRLYSLIFFLTFSQAIANSDQSIADACERIHGKILIEAELSGIDKSILSTMNRYSRGILHITDFLGKKYTEGSILGLQGSTMTKVSQLTGLKDFWDAYDSLGVSPFAPNHKETFLRKLVNSGQTIVFLIPKKFMGEVKHSNSKTLGEFIWLMEDKEVRLKNVIFVVGAYDRFEE